MNPMVRIITWSANMIQHFMNSISVLQDHRRLIRENERLREQLAFSNQLSPSKQRFNPTNDRPESIKTELDRGNPYESTRNIRKSEPKIESDQFIDEKQRLENEILGYRQKNAEILERYAKLNDEMKKRKINSFESLAEQDKEMMKFLIELARSTQPIQMEGNNVALFGSTSTGKSTMLNSLLGQKVAETGVGETTMKITPYQGNNLTLWDVPGRNDELSYFTLEYISFFKGLTHRVVLIQATVKENSSMMRLLDEIGLRYDIVFNKFDKVDEDERSAVQQQINAEIKSIGLKGVNRIFFVSSKYPQMFSDWKAMIDHLETQQLNE